MAPLIEVTDNILKELDKNNLPYKVVKEDRISREERLRKLGFNLGNFVYGEYNQVYLLKNPRWPIQSSLY